MDLVSQQLKKSIFKVCVVPLELPSEMLFQVSVGKPVGHPLLEGESVAVAIGDWRRWSTRAQISRNISWDACFSPKSMSRHLAMNSSARSRGVLGDVFRLGFSLLI